MAAFSSREYKYPNIGSLQMFKIKFIDMASSKTPQSLTIRVAALSFISLPFIVCNFSSSKPVIEYLKSYFDGNYILNAYGGNLNLKKNFTYASSVHRDVRTYTREIKFLLNIIVMLDDFTLDNGATYLLGGSHLKKEKPSDDEFFARAGRAVGKSGSIVFWDSNIWHAAGENKTDLPRRSLSLIYSKPFMKQQFDYPRSVGYENVETMSEEFRQIVGYNARVPATLEEWYQPPEKRFYKKDQG